MAMNKWREWERFNACTSLCLRLGCKKRNVEACCPELMTTLCPSKMELLKSLGINEADLIENKITLEDIIAKHE